MMPHRWDSRRQSLAARELGFDPGNPLVVSEIRRILDRGPAGRPNASPAATDDLLFGYAEVPVETPELDVSAESTAVGAVSTRGDAADGLASASETTMMAEVAPRDASPPGAARRSMPGVGMESSPLIWLLGSALALLVAVAVVGGWLIWLKAGREA
jgi:hypothetical protein